MALGVNGGDPVEAVARVATARRDRLLRIHRRRLRWEDLEDCYSQATLELVVRARRDPFASADHIGNALEQKFCSRIDDRRRAIGGRSPIETAIARAVPVDAPGSPASELEDRAGEVTKQVDGRLELRRLREVAEELTEDQRLVLACQVSLGMDCAEFCRRFGWSAEKFRKVAQRARARLRALVSEYQLGERCERLEPDLLAYIAGAAASGAQAHRAAAHLENCTACASRVRALERASRQVAAILPAPVLVKAGALAKLGGLAVAARRIFISLGRGPTEAGAAGVAGGSAVGTGAVKLGVAAACLAGAAGGYAICAPGPGIGVGHHRPHAHVARVARTSTKKPTAPASATTPGAAVRGVAARTRPVTGALARQVARREFGSTPAHVASIELPGAGIAGTTGGSTPRPRATQATSASARRDQQQAQMEFSSFER